MEQVAGISSLDLRGLGHDLDAASRQDSLSASELSVDFERFFLGHSHLW